MFIKSVGTIAQRMLLRRSMFVVLPTAALLMCGGLASAAKPEVDLTYANGQTVYMIGPRLIEHADTLQPHLYATAEELYLLVYPFADAGTNNNPHTLATGYQPQCNPCYHPGLPPPFVYHDHVLVGAPGMGTNGTALNNKGPWKIILLVYSTSVLTDPGFQPITNAADIPAAEVNGEFQVMNADAENPYEIDTGNVLICPVVSPAA